ncbi:hypothetical protein [Actinoplanes sp. URMC 104]|uniref:hypothetical protein n=1 Tax=Actinoplanes sp. URMC 104 TaxID=3423409 RepID=UPI003F1D3A40
MKAVLVLAGTGLLLAGCLPAVAVRSAPAAPAGTAPAVSTGTAPASAPPVPQKTGPEAIEVFRAALRKTHNATYKYSVSSQLPDKQRVAGTGTFDRRSRKLQSSMKYTGGANPHTLQMLVIADDLYTKEPGESRWVHLDMGRLKKDSMYRVDLADPVGLAAFSGALRKVRQSGPHTFTGTFDQNPPDTEEFLPLGAPSIIVFGLGTTEGAFSATTDAQGRVTVINAKITADETITMTTRFSGHGKPSGITKPRRTGEAFDFYYD